MVPYLLSGKPLPRWSVEHPLKALGRLSGRHQRGVAGGRQGALAEASIRPLRRLPTGRELNVRG